MRRAKAKKTQISYTRRYKNYPFSLHSLPSELLPICSFEKPMKIYQKILRNVSIHEKYTDWLLKGSVWKERGEDITEQIFGKRRERGENKKGKGDFCWEIGQKWWFCGSSKKWSSEDFRRDRGNEGEFATRFRRDIATFLPFGSVLCLVFLHLVLSCVSIFLFWVAVHLCLCSEVVTMWI